VAAWLDRVHAATRPPLWLDDTAYTARLLAGGRAPWNDVAACVEWRRAALRLLAPDVAVLDIAAMVREWVAQALPPAPGLAAAPPVTARLGAMLVDRDFRDRTLDLATALRASTDRPLALAIPSPWRWVMLACTGAVTRQADIDEDAVDDATLHIADFLRQFGACGVDALLLEDADDGAAAQAVGLYQTILNLGRHYRWDLGWHLSESPPAGHGFDFVIAPCRTAGIAIPAGFWQGEAPPVAARGEFLYASIPVDADPRRVLERLAVLR